MEYKNYLRQMKNDRMDTVIETAAALFLERGIESVKMTDIAAGCEIGVASLYRYYETKTAIVIKVGEHLWEKVRRLFDGVFECDYYAEKNGAQQIAELLKLQLILYSAHRDFLRFLSEFDAYMVREGVPAGELSDYEKSIMNIYPLFEKAYQKGVSDGTLRPDIDFTLTYKSITHTLMSLCEKFILGEILPSDDFGDAEREIALISEMALDYIRNKNTGVQK